MKKIALTAVAITLLAACGSSATKTASTTASSPPAASATTTAATAASAATAGSPATTGAPSAATGATTAAGATSGVGTLAAPTGQPFKVLFIGALSGPLAAIGGAQLQGLKAGAAQVNATGGILGRPVEVTTVDDQADATKAVSALQQQLTSAKPDMVIPGVNSDTGAAVLPILTDNKIFSYGAIVSAAVASTTKFPYFFSIAQNQQNAYNALADSAKAAGATSIAYLRPDSAAGETDVGQLQTAAKKDGITVTDIVYSPTAVDLTQVMQQALDSKPGMIALDAYGPSAGYLLQARFKLKVTIPTTGALIFCLGNPTAYVEPAQLQGVTLECPKFLVADPASPDSAAKTQFLTRLAAAGDIKGILTQYSGLYDIMMLTQLAATQANSTVADALKSALEAFKEPAVKPYVTYGSVQYSGTNHFVLPPVTDYAFIKATTVKNGQYQAGS